MVQAVPIAIAGALAHKNYYFVPLALATGEEAKPRWWRRPTRRSSAIRRSATAMSTTMARRESSSLRDCWRQVCTGFRVLHQCWPCFVDVIGVPEVFDQLVWGQAIADIRGETSQDAWESRNLALGASGQTEKVNGRPVVDERARNNLLKPHFPMQLRSISSRLSVDFDYSELREREYPLLAPQALADGCGWSLGCFLRIRLRVCDSLPPPRVDVFATNAGRAI